MAVALYKHNEEAYQKLISTLKNNKYATINHATGTGKSYIILKYMEEHPNARILYIAPTYEIINQLINRDAPKLGIEKLDNVDTLIYRTLLDKNMSDLALNYDVFILDEYHRAGAKKTNNRIKELKEIINNADKKMIGFSATPTRYLDNKRNMKEELFEDVEASELSVATAMANNLLPVPLYVVSKMALKDDYAKAIRSVDRLFPSSRKQKLLRELNSIFPQGESYKKTINKYVKENSKNIVFCSTIGDLNETIKESELWFEDYDNVFRYAIHSGKTHEENIRTLNEFNLTNNGLSVLFVINILNEGIHVDSVDNIILNRRTTSPIIYLQQIGRVLSANQVNRDVTIIDLVNNFDATKEIRELFLDIEDEINKKMGEDSLQKELYQEKLNKLKSAHATAETLERLRNIRNEVTRETIIDSKIENSINILDCYQKQIKKRLTMYNILDPKVKNAYIYIYKYVNYITNEQFDLLKEIDMVLPLELQVTFEERKEQLKGYNSIFLRDMAVLKQNFEDVLVALDTHIPDANSSDEEERALGNIYMDLLVSSNKDDLNLLKNKAIKFDLSPIEKALFRMELSNEEIEKLIISAYDSYKGDSVSEQIKKALSSVYGENKKYDELIIKLLNLIEKRENQQIEKINKNLKLIRLLNQITEDKDDYEDDYYFMEDFEKLSMKEQMEVNKKIEFARHRKYYKMMKQLNSTYSISEYMDIYSKLDEDNIDYYREVIAECKNLNNLLKDYVKNDGDLKEEVLDEISQMLQKRGMILDDIKKTMQKNKTKFYSKLLEEDIQLEKKDFLCLYTRFIKVHERKPLQEIEEEATLYEQYWDYLNIFSKGEIDCILKKVNTNKVLDNTLKMRRKYYSKQLNVRFQNNGRQVK